MKLYPDYGILFLALIFLTTACKTNIEHNESVSVEDNQDSLETKNIESETNNSLPTKGQSAFILVNNLRLREHHDLKSKVIAMLKEGEEVIFLGDVSENTEEIELRGEKKNAPFYKVKTLKGFIGWVYGGAISFKSIISEIDGYQAVIAFVRDSEKTNAEAMADWSSYSSEALDIARKSGVLTSFADEDFHKVLIKDKEGNIMDEVNILSFTKEHQWGLVCVEKGKNPHFIPFAPEMAEAVVSHFQLAAAQEITE